MLVDPTIIMQVSMEGQIEIELNGTNVRIDLTGDYKKAAGAEILLFGPDKHNDGTGVLAQLARVAMIGNCPELGGRVMLRASWPKGSGGTLGDGTEESLSRVKYPSELHIDAQFELATPHGVLYTTNPIHINGKLTDIEPTGTQLSMDGPDSALVTADGQTKARLSNIRMAMRESIIGAEAHVST
jgi:Family of unknown function (DUF6004)